MKSFRSIVLTSLAATSLATLLISCGNYNSSSSTGGSMSGTGGATGGNTGGSTATGGSAGGNTGGSGPGTGGTTTTVSCKADESRLPCEILETDGNKCVSAHSTVRVIVRGYEGPLYQLCKGQASAGPNSCKGETKDVPSKDGYADISVQEEFCTEICKITKIYDQSGQGNDLEPAPRGQAKTTPDQPANAAALPVSINGNNAFGILIKPGIGYRTGCTECNIKTGKGMAKDDQAQSMYMVTSKKDLVDGCCFDYGNAETTSNNDGNGTMEAVYFGAGVVWGTGYGGKPGPWVMADIENGVYAGWENGQWSNISTNTKLEHDYVTAVVLGDTKEKNNGKGRFALYGGNANSGALKTMWDGIRPEKPGYVPMQKQGSLILGIGGDNSNGGGGRFYEGAVATGGPVVSKEVVDTLQCAIIAAKYADR